MLLLLVAAAVPAHTIKQHIIKIAATIKLEVVTAVVTVNVTAVKIAVPEVIIMVIADVIVMVDVMVDVVTDIVDELMKITRVDTISMKTLFNSIILT